MLRHAGRWLDYLTRHHAAARPDPTVRLTAHTAPGAPIERPAGALRPLVMQRVQRKPESRLWNEYIERYHYLGHKPLPGAQLRYLIHADEQPIRIA